LIKYLEEKFPGGVSGAFGKTPYVLVINPTTPTTTRAFIQPACDKFNKLESTQLETVVYEGRTLIKAAKIAPTLLIIYAVTGEVLRSMYRKGITKDPYLLPGHLEKEITQHNTDFLQKWLTVMIQEDLSKQNCIHLRKLTDQYSEVHGGGEELGRLEEWLRRQRRKEDKREQRNLFSFTSRKV